MSREIKFRAWNIKEKWMEEVLPCPNAGLNVFFKDLSKTHKIMQFAGLLDKNKKEIFEGDIVKIGRFYFYDKEIKGQNLQVIFIEGGWHLWKIGGNVEEYVADLFERVINNGVEVIGNIYENPELLEVQK